MPAAYVECRDLGDETERQAAPPVTVPLHSQFWAEADDGDTLRILGVDEAAGTLTYQVVHSHPYFERQTAPAIT